MSNIDENLVYGYINSKEGDGKYVTVLLKNTKENIASFIAKASVNNNLSICNLADEIILTTFGFYLDSCPDQEYRGWILEDLVELQNYIKEPKDIEFYIDEELEMTKEEYKKWVYEKTGYSL